MKPALSAGVVVGLFMGAWVSSPAGAVTIVEEGVTRAAIVVPENGSPAARRAIPILQSHIKQISGAVLPLIKESDAQGGATAERALVLIGESKLAEKLGFTAGDVGAGGFRVEAKGNVLAIIGTEARSPADPWGTVYGTTTFLEEKLGVRYLWPGESGKVVPKRRTIAVNDFAIRSAPAMVQRHIRVIGYNDRLEQGLARLRFTKADFDKGRREGQKTEAETSDWFQWQRLGGTLNIAGGHAFGHLWAKYGKEHPEWFALQPNGSRDQSFAGADRARLCKSNPGLIAAIAREKIEELKAKPQLLGVSLSPNDGGRATFCTCAKCEALDAREGRKIMLWDMTGKERKQFEHVSLTDRMVYFWNAIAEEVGKTYPDKLFTVDAYSAYTSAPLQRKLHPNLVVRFASLEYGSEEARRQGVADWDAWAKATKRIYFRSNCMLAGRRTGLPWLYGHRFAEDFAHFAATGMMGTDLDSCAYNWATQGLNYYIVARLHWDPKANVDAMIDDYCRAGFGPAAKTMRRYFDRLEGVFTESAKQAGREDPTVRLTDEVLAELAKLIASAKGEAAQDAEALGRVEFIAMGQKWTEIEVRAHRLLADLANVDRAVAKRVMDERYGLMREIFTKYPQAVNVGYVSWGEDGLLWSRLRYKAPQE